MEFINLDDVIDAIATGLTAPEHEIEQHSKLPLPPDGIIEYSRLDEMWRCSKAAARLHAELTNNRDSERPKWAAYHAETEEPVFSDAATSDGMLLLTHMSGWYRRQVKVRVDHVIAFVNSGLDPTAHPMGHDLNAGKYPRKYLFCGGIGFDRLEITFFLATKGIPHSFAAQDATTAHVQAENSGDGKLDKENVSAQPKQITGLPYSYSRDVIDLYKNDLLSNDGIKLLFPDCEVNWKEIFKRPGRYNLRQSNEPRGKYNPAIVAGFLIRNGHIKKTDADRILKKALPSWATQFRHEITGDPPS